jgi:hypothetical protein
MNQDLNFVYKDNSSINCPQRTASIAPGIYFLAPQWFELRKNSCSIRRVYEDAEAVAVKDSYCKDNSDSKNDNFFLAILPEFIDHLKFSLCD